MAPTVHQLWTAPMQRTAPWLMLVTLLLGVLLMRDPHVQHLEDLYLSWLLQNADPAGPTAPLTVVQLGTESLFDKNGAKPGSPATAAPPADGALRTATGAVSPIEYALFLQAVLEFQPAVVAVEPVLRWPEENRDQQQIFVDQAMRVSKLLLGAELTPDPDPDAPTREVPIFPNVTGKRTDLVEFSGVEAQPIDELRPISTLGFLNLPKEITTPVYVPLLFQYRGEVVPSFSLQAVLLWLRITPREVKIELGSHILMPNGWKIPIRSDGTAVISPKVVKHVRRISLNELLLASQQRDAGKQTTVHLEDMEDQIVLLHAADQHVEDSNVFASTIATIQTNQFVRRISWIFDLAVVLAAVVLSPIVRFFSRVDVLLGAVAFSAAFLLIALGTVSHLRIWLPGWLPLGMVWLLVLVRMFIRDPLNSAASNEESQPVTT